jgi:hypothetical protein
MDRLPVVPPHSPKFCVPSQVVRLGALRRSAPGGTYPLILPFWRFIRVFGTAVVDLLFADLWITQPKQWVFPKEFHNVSRFV